MSDGLRRAAAGMIVGMGAGAAIGGCASLLWLAGGRRFGRVDLSLIDAWMVYLVGGAVAGGLVGMLLPWRKTETGVRLLGVVIMTPMYVTATTAVHPDLTGLLVGVGLGLVFGYVGGPRLVERVVDPAVRNVSGE